MARLHLLKTTMLALSVVACGGKSKHVGVAPANNNSAGLTESNCKTKDNCPAAEPAYGANMAAAGAFVGWVGEPVAWRVYAVDEHTKNPDGTSSARHMVVLLDKVPSDSKILPAASSKPGPEATIEWTPDRELSGQLDIIVRDYERCLVDQGTSAGFCDKYVFLNQYDKRFKSVPWAIKDRNKLEQELADGTVTEENAGKTTETCNQSSGSNTAAITQSILSTFIQALSNPNGLAGATTTFSSVLGAAAGGTTPGC